ncbi:autophagy-related protein 16 [Cyclospora cayetanensis]|uniref:Autophagy-related protein 16 n=1 Tax=Cyclospora cayetanensis TaxID=88456 RepID=A0A6P6RW31_9EIME|nr:autophagy-related protein 16 [Cyclospora cayetanensis]
MHLRGDTSDGADTAAPVASRRVMNTNRAAAGAEETGPPERLPLWREVFLRRARIKHLLQHDWFAAVCAAHAAAVEENRRLLANHASTLAVRSAAAAQEGLAAAATSAAAGGPCAAQTEHHLQNTPDSAVLKQQIRAIKAAAAATQRQYEQRQQQLETELLVLMQQVQQQQQLLAEKDSELLQQQRQLREKEEEIAENEAQAAATRRTCLLLVQQQQQQQQAVQKAQQEVAAKALETEGYLRELLRYKQAEAASLELLQDQMRTSASSADAHLGPSTGLTSGRDTPAAASLLRSRQEPSADSESAHAVAAARAAAGGTPTAAAALPSSSPPPNESTSIDRNCEGSCRPPLRLLRTIHMQNGSVLCCCSRPIEATAGRATAGELFVSGGADGTLAVLGGVRPGGLYSVQPSPLRAACTAVDVLLLRQKETAARSQEALALIGCIDAALYVTQLPRGKVLQTLKGHSGGAIVACGFLQPKGDAASATAEAAWSVANDRSLRLWDIHRSASSRCTTLQSRPTAAAAAADGAMLLIGHRNSTLSLFTPSSRSSSGSSRSNSRIWSADMVSPPLHSGEGVVGVAISPNGHTVCTLGEDKVLQLLDLRMMLQQRHQEQTLTHPLLRCNTVAAAPCFSPCGSLLAVATGSHLLIWDLKQKAASCNAVKASHALSSNSSGADMVSDSLAALQVQQLYGDGPISVLHGGSAEISCLAWSNCGNSSRLFAGCRDGTVCVWE